MENKTISLAAPKLSLWEIFLKFNPLIMLLILIVISAIISPVFFTPNNIFNLLRQQSPVLLMSMGMLLTILTGGIDLSVGSNEALGGVVMALMISQYGLHSAPGGIVSILIVIAIGAGFGSLTGIASAYLRIPPFVASLAVMTIVRGVAYIIFNGYPINIRPNTEAGVMLDIVGNKFALGAPIPVWIALIVVVVLALVMKFTSFGRVTIATGSNESAVRLAGINTKLYKFLPYLISGGLCAFAGVITTARSAVGTPVIGTGLELDCIAAVVIGGASLSGGKGTVVETAIGVIILGLIGNIMNLMAVPAYPQQVIKGIIILLAVLLRGFEKENG